MPNQLPLDMPGSVLAEVQKHLAAIKVALVPHLISLTLKERKIMLRMADKTVAFVTKTTDYATKTPRSCRRSWHWPGCSMIPFLKPAFCGRCGAIISPLAPLAASAGAIAAGAAPRGPRWVLPGAGRAQVGPAGK
ncbi:hypothetical protein [Hymenobacter terricola]|uniref:hypothetical protein n=1 Tax=Hymenobacter terricola TaxID=2819236 RepID=UPI001B3042E3|nr:hypothetical protein [Hymenobacter terricola]